MPRPKGVLNKIGAQVKENIVAVFTRLGGTAAMAEKESDRVLSSVCQAYPD